MGEDMRRTICAVYITWDNRLYCRK